MHVEKDMSNRRTWWPEIESCSTDRKDFPLKSKVAVDAG